MISEQTFEGRRENFEPGQQASRAYAVLLDALNRHPGKGQQKVTMENVQVRGQPCKAPAMPNASRH